MKEKKGEGCVSCHVVLTPSDLPIPIFQIQIINLCLFLLGIDGEPHTMQVSMSIQGGGPCIHETAFNGII